MVKTFQAAVIAIIFVASPANAQQVPDAAKDAMEMAEDAAQVAAQAAADSAMEPQIRDPYVDDPWAAPPQLIEFDMLQALPADYPPASWVADEEGHAYYELAVDAQGHVTDCRIIESTGFAALDAKTCEIAFARAQFTPATDEAGVPVASIHRDHQVWRKRSAQFTGNSSIHVQYTLTAQGETIDCDVIEISGDIGEEMRETMEREPCPGIGRSSQPPVRDEAGVPVARRVDLMIVVKSEEVAD